MCRQEDPDHERNGDCGRAQLSELFGVYREQTGASRVAYQVEYHSMASCTAHPKSIFMKNERMN